jgi:hypothetical protein
MIISLKSIVQNVMINIAEVVTKYKLFFLVFL